jgi:hypothetical protein
MLQHSGHQLNRHDKDAKAENEEHETTDRKEWANVHPSGRA